MIDFSPHSKYTAQKLTDKVARGAYFYSKFELQKKDSEVREKIERLNEIYQFNLNKNQKAYRLRSGKPVADLIVQKSMFDEKWLFILLIKTPMTTKHSAKKTVFHIQDYNQIKTNEINEIDDIEWTKETVEQELKLIEKTFNDKQPLKFVLKKPFLVLDLGKYSIELLRLSNKKYRVSEKYKNSERNYTWTWRFTKSSYELLKEELKGILNKHISQTRKDVPLYNLKNWQIYIKKWAVFKGTRKQAGILFAYGKTYYFAKSKHKWEDLELPVMRLTLLPRLETYADTFDEYIERRYYYVTNWLEVPRELVARRDFDEIGEYIEKERKRRDAEGINLDWNDDI